MFKNSYFRVALFTLLLTAAVGVAGSIKVWSSGDTLSISDINSNFSHIHNSMVGGHGARLVNADVSTSANIGYTKIENGRGIARAWVEIPAIAACPATQAIGESLNVTSVTCASAGVYSVTLAYTATDAVYAALVSSITSTTTCKAVSTSTTVVTVNCVDDATAGTPTDSAFSLVVFDGD